VVPQGTRTIEDTGSLALGLLKQMGGVEILAVKRRVLAHQDRIEVTQGLRTLMRGLLRSLKPGRLLAGERDVTHIGGHRLTALPGQVFGLAGAQPMTASLRLLHHGKGAVLVNLEGLQRIGNEQQVHGIRFRFSSPARPPNC
jgi:hypothetical protein